MNCKGLSLTLLSLVLGSPLVYGRQSSRPDFSGIWLLERDKSDLKNPPISTNQSQPGGGGRVGGGRGGSGAGGSRTVGAHGMGGGVGGERSGGRSERGMGGVTPGNRTPGSTLKFDLDLYQIGETTDKLTIEQANPTVTIKPTLKMEKEEQTLEFIYTTDGKSHQRKMEDGGSVTSKTSWEGTKLVTKSKEQSALGSLEIVEARSLSVDGNTLTINLSFKGNSSHWEQRAVYIKEKSDTKTGEKEK